MARVVLYVRVVAMLDVGARRARQQHHSGSQKDRGSFHVRPPTFATRGNPAFSTIAWCFLARLNSNPIAAAAASRELLTFAGSARRHASVKIANLRDA